MRHVLVGGGSGFIGTALCSSLKNKGYQVTLISRQEGKNQISWNQVKKAGLPSDPRFDAIIQLSGANIMQYAWTSRRKNELLESRVGTTRILVDAIQRIQDKHKLPNVFICGSAVGYYPTNTKEEFTEEYSGNPAQSFPGYLCEQWEKCSSYLKHVRKVIVRHGIVLGPNGGSLKDILPLFRLGLGGKIGNGNQYWPWVHIDDSVGIMEHAIEVRFCCEKHFIVLVVVYSFS